MIKHFEEGGRLSKQAVCMGSGVHGRGLFH